MAAKNKAQGHMRDGGVAIAQNVAAIMKPAAIPLAAAAIYFFAAFGIWQYGVANASHPSSARVDARSCPWLSASDVDAINADIHLSGQASMYDADLCRDVAQTYKKNPWVDQVVAVRRRFPDQVEVELVVRKPVAYVHRAGLYYMIDESACRLPVTPATRPDNRYPVLEGVASAPPAAGEAWNDEAVIDSLRLAEVLNEVLANRGSGGRLTGIDAKAGSGYDKRPQMVAQLASGARIDWGSFRESKSHSLPSVNEKRAELEKQLAMITDLSTVSCIQVKYRKGTVTPRPPITAEGGAVGMLP